MGLKEENARNRKITKPLGMMLLLIACGVALNFVGVSLAGSLGPSLYLDTLGTILAAALGGYIPGIVTGFITNLINGMSDVTNAYYGAINALIGIAATYFAEHGFFRKLWKAIVTVPVFAFIGGVLGGIITWCIYGMSFDPSATLAVRFFEAGMTPFWAQIIAAFIIDLADKGIMVLAAFAVIRLLPEQWRSELYYEGWRQAPLTAEQKQAARRSGAGKSSLNRLIVGLIAIAMIAEGVSLTFVYGVLYHNNMIEEQKTLGLGVASLIGSAIDPDRVDAYLTEGESAEGYLETEERLQAIRTSSPYIEYIYVYQILPDGCHVVFDLDTEEVEGGEPGDLVEFDESFEEYLPALLAGERIEPLITDDTFGWLLTAYQPVYDSEGVCKCYAAVDISMNRLRVAEVGFLAKETSLFLGIFFIVLFLGVWIARYHIILPINTMTLAASEFAYDTEEARHESVERFRALDIYTGDEIESLYHATDKTMSDTVMYVEDIREKGETISKMQNGLILVLADMVESRDKCTGDHVRKTAAYAGLIMDHMRKLGIYEGQITDAFYSDVVNSAPLHDVGKIQVSDAILNKPGRLTDEEFATMKTHTTAGKEIISQAIEMVGDDTGYLHEARNLAAYHHERWDGKGYPTGLAGEEIPLSARIMAAADVFDALVSERSYKKPFTFEQAMEIISEGAGTQFDPEVVRAFLDGAEEARDISQRFLQ